MSIYNNVLKIFENRMHNATIIPATRSQESERIDDFLEPLIYPEIVFNIE